MALTRKNKIILIIIGLIVGSVVLFLRGPYVSNFLKSLILPQAQRVLGRQVIAQKMVVNIFPLYIEAKEVKAFNGDGERLFAAESVKAYIGLSKILNKQVTLDSIVIRKPQFWFDKALAEEIAANVKKTGEEPTKGKKFLDLHVKNIVIQDGEVHYFDAGRNGLVEAAGLDAEIFLRDRPEIAFSSDSIKAAVEGWPEIEAEVSSNLVVGADSIEVKRAKADVGGSIVSGSGNYSFDRTGDFRLDVDLLMDTVKNVMGLAEPGYGSMRARGTLRLEKDFRDSVVDFNVKGDFYLQTLLELVKARTSHRLTGLVSFNGKLDGSFSHPRVNADARLHNGNLYTVDINDLTCKASYEDMMLRFVEGKASFYGGTADVEVSILLPHANPFTLRVDFKGVDSPPAFERIGMSWLDLPYGKVHGWMYTAGNSFDPKGWAEFEVLDPRDDPIGRFKKIGGNYKMVHNVVTLSDMVAKTEASKMAFGGVIDINKSSLDLDGTVASGDIKEFMTPYFDRLSGKGTFKGGVSGLWSDPLVKGKMTLSDAYLDEYPIGEVEGNVTYRKNLLTVLYARGMHGDSTSSAKGTVAFPKAKYLLDLHDPDFDLTVGMKRADLAGILKLHKLDVPATGMADGEVSITGGGPLYAGKVVVSDGSAYGYDVSRASLGFSYDFDTFNLKNAVLKNGESELMVDGSVTKDGVFKFKANSEKFYPADVVKQELPLTYRMVFEARGEGTFDQPDISLKANLSEGNFMGREVGGGKLDACLKGKELAYDARVFKDKMVLKGSAILDGDMPWSADLEITKGRFDFLATAFLKEVPEDMLFNITGKAAISGTRNRFDAKATLSQITLAMFGQSFSNDDDISFTVEDGKVILPRFKLRSGIASVNLQGSFRHKDFFDVMIDGTSSLAPLKAFSDNISLIKGNARFVLALRGDWDMPNVNGGIDVTDGAFGLKAFPQRLASINGYAYFEDDRVVIERIGAKLGGGDIEVSGAIRLAGLGVENANIDMLLKDVNLSLTKGIKANIGGNVIYRGTPASRLITGEVAINRAEYKDRIEWRSWLLKLRQAESVEARKGPFDDVRLSLRLYGADNISVDNNVARANIAIDTILRGTVGEPLLLGRVEATDGKVYFRNSEFNIVHSTADFADTSHREPYVDIVAETTVKGYHVWLTLEGRLDQLDLTLVSDPTLEDEEIIALLTVGEFGEKLSGLEGGIGAAEASSVLTGQFQNVVEERLRDLTGITRFTIDPYVSRRTGTITPRVTVSKRLGKDIFVTYSSSMSTSEEQEVKLEYEVNKNVSLLGGQDDLGTLGGDVRFRFFFK